MADGYLYRYYFGKNKLKACLTMAELMLANIQMKTDVLDNPKYNYLFSVEEANRLVLAGVPFRDAYKQVAQTIEKGEFKVSQQISHTHEGSIGNLCNEQITNKIHTILNSFEFKKVHDSINKLLKS